MKTQVWIIDDDANNRQQYLRSLDGLELSFRQFEMIYEAYQANGICDYALIDISALSAGNYGNPLHSAYSPIAGFHKKHPGAVIIICTAFTREQCRETVETVKEICPECVIHYADIFDIDDLRRRIQ